MPQSVLCLQTNKFKMILLIPLLFLIGIATSAPTTDAEKTFTIDKTFFNEQLVLYSADHDIVNIHVPTNLLNDDNKDDRTKPVTKDVGNSGITLFFVLGDVKDGKADFKGLHIYHQGNVTKILDNGVDVTSKVGQNRDVYFGAKDGLYRLREGVLEAEKYGPINDSIIAITVLSKADEIYIITEDHTVYRVTENGQKKTKVNDIKNAREIVVDVEDNVYYMDEDSSVFVGSQDKFKKVDGLPKPVSYAKLVKGLSLTQPESANVVIDDEVYLVYANGTSLPWSVTLKVRPTAYEPSLTLIQYYAYGGKIYEYNILLLMMTKLFAGFRKFMSEVGVASLFSSFGSVSNVLNH